MKINHSRAMLLGTLVLNKIHNETEKHTKFVTKLNKFVSELKLLTNSTHFTKGDKVNYYLIFFTIKMLKHAGMIKVLQGYVGCGDTFKICFPSHYCMNIRIVHNTIRQFISNYLEHIQSEKKWITDAKKSVANGQQSIAKSSLTK